MNVAEAIVSRRSIRKYKETPIEPEKMHAVAEAFRRAPSAKNLQDWQLLWVTSPQHKEKIRLASPSKAAMLTEAPAVLVAVGYRPDVMTNGHRADSIDLSIAMSYALLAAHEQGLGTCWMANYTEDGIRQALGLPENVTVVAISPIGYADEEPAEKIRKPLCDVFKVIP